MKDFRGTEALFFRHRRQCAVFLNIMVFVI